MKALITSSGQFGPFACIEKLDDRYRCDDVEFQFSVIGDATVGDYVAPPPPPEPVPQEVTMAQARLALLGAGLLDKVAAALAALPSPQKEAAQIEWEYRPTVLRTSALVVALAPALSMSSAQLDELFIAAGKL